MLLSFPSIRQVVDQNTGEEQVCEERDGWCVPGTKDKLRDMISGMIKKVIRAQKPGRLKKILSLIINNKKSLICY